MDFKKLRFTLLLCTLIGINLNAQNGEWEIDRFEKKRLNEINQRDSLKNQLNKKWELQLNFGSWFQSENAKSESNEVYYFPNRMNLWQIELKWHLTEQIIAIGSFGIQLEKEVPPRPNILSVLNGDELKLEGSGGGFFPIELGLKYYLSAGRFRPKLGISNGVVIARSSYILAEGNIFEGIRRTEYNSNDSKWFYNINAGFDYRLGYNWNLSTNVAYYNSAKFEDSIGGLDYYKGILMNIGLSIVF